MKTKSDSDQESKEEINQQSETPDHEEGKILSDDDFDSDTGSAEQELEDSTREYEELHNQHLRLAADFENYKKRVTKEKADLISYGNEELIRSLLSVVDNLERAIDHSESITGSESIIEGIKLVQKQFIDCLEKFGVSEIKVRKGDEFDPNSHQAVERVKTDEVKPGSILSEMLKGYKLKDRLLRPAIVSVSQIESEPSTTDITSIGSVISEKKNNGHSDDVSD